MSDRLAPLPDEAWNSKFARHLLGRAGFGVPIEEVARLEAMGLSEAVDHFLNYERFPEVEPEPDWLEDPRRTDRTIKQASRELELQLRDEKLTEEERLALRSRFARLKRSISQEEGRDIEALKRWWLRRMLNTQRPLQEKMTLFWHGHFATSSRKVKKGWPNYHLNRLFREKATANFWVLTKRVIRSPAMIMYLDSDKSTKDKPNENLARELMELFTMGPGGYTESDVKNAARALTGWSTDGYGFVFRPGLHDDQVKRFMGYRGRLSGDQLVGLIFEQPATSLFIVRKLWAYFAYSDPDDEIVQGLAGTLRDNRYELKPLLRRMFLSREFYSERSVGSNIKSPVQVLLSMASLLDIAPDRAMEQAMLGSLRSMGQDLFAPPNVAGWPGGETWIDTSKMLNRLSLADLLLSKGGPFEPKEFFGRFYGWELGKLADYLGHYFTGQTLEESQRRAIVEALAGKYAPDVRMDPEFWSTNDLRRAVRLILATAEFQLC